MLFSSVIFLFWFLPIFLVFYLLADPKYKNGVILAGSIFFYAFGAPKFIFAFLGTSLVDFHLVKAMHVARSQQAKRRYLILSLALNLGLLGFFKYSNFFVENVNALLQGIGMGTIGWTEIALPLGISFFIFESLTYVLDVYRGVHAPLTRFWEYQMYILMFPTLIAGPIVRYHEIADQIRERKESADLFLTGFYRFVIGLSKKVLIANRLGVLAAPYFVTEPSQLSAGQAWVGLIAATLQMYFDFSGYSDMALGLGRMMGFRLPENFNNPFISGSLTEFWQRWHISLSAWLQNYLFMPLAIQLRDHRRWGISLAISVTFLVSGLWHGAAWNFVIWGAFHGFWLIMERLFLGKWLARLGRPVGMIYTALLVVLAYGIFKIDHFAEAFRFYGALFSWRTGVPHTPPLEFWWIFATAVLLSILAVWKPMQKTQDWMYAEHHGNIGHVALVGISCVLLVACASFIVWDPFNPFLYFRF